MPIGQPKNRLYGFALPLVGKRCAWKNARRVEAGTPDLTHDITRLLRKNHVVGGCVQLIRKGQLAELYIAGNASLNPAAAVRADTYFRTASIAKFACAMLVMRLQTRGLLHVEEDISSFWGSPIRNPNHPETSIPLASLLSHTSGIMDSPLYYRSFDQPVTVSEILADGGCFTSRQPLEQFQYSNFAAGLIGSLLEKRFGESLETLIQREVFVPLGMRATFDLASLGGASVADSYRVLPASKTPAFSVSERFRGASPMDTADAERHYQLGSGSLFVTGDALARLCLPLFPSAQAQAEPFLNASSVQQMLTPLTAWPEPEVNMRHGMGLLTVEDAAISPLVLHGHQGFAYGAVNGVFFRDDGLGFVSLNSGASEKRTGHLSCLNRDLIRLCLNRENVNDQD